MLPDDDPPSSLRDRDVPDDFDSPYQHGFARIAAAVPRLMVADPEHNLARIRELLQQAHQRGAVAVVFPELALSAYSADDLLL